MTPVQVCNLALLEIGHRVPINSFTDASPAAFAANTFYVPKTQMLERSANWDFARAQITLTVWKQASINGQTSPNPPPQPWLFSYLYPPDCLKARFLLPTVPQPPAGVPLTTAPQFGFCGQPVMTGIPFVIGTDLDHDNNPIKVLLTNLPAAQLIYTRDLSQIPDLWDSLFLSGVTAFLASYFINALARNKAQYDDQVGIAKGVLDQARVANGNESISSADHMPDWIQARWHMRGGNYLTNGATGTGYGGFDGWDSATFACGLRY